MKLFRIGVQISYYDTEPYEVWEVYTHTEEEALSLVNSLIGKYCGHRFLRVLEGEK